MKRISFTFAALTVSALLALGCSGDKPTDNDTADNKTAANGSQIDGSKYILKEEPKGGVDVIKARETAKDGDDIVVVGRIGGKRDPWLKGRAMFVITDRSLKPCTEDGCKTPWDYCCSSDLGTSRANVTVVDENDKVLKAGAKDLLNLKELQTVVIKGKAKVLDGGNLTILASGIYVKE